MNPPSKSKALRLLVLICGLLAASSVHAQLTYDIYFDEDLDTATGCDVSLSHLGETIMGAERRLRATVNRNTLTVDSVEMAICASGVFLGLGPVAGGYPVALDAGFNGAEISLK